MTDTEQRNAATKFYNDWRGIGDEKSDSQRFWIDFFTNVLGIENVLHKIEFEKRVVVDGQTKYIDVYIPETRVLIEQKALTRIWTGRCRSQTVQCAHHLSRGATMRNG